MMQESFAVTNLWRLPKFQKARARVLFRESKSRVFRRKIPRFDTRTGSEDNCAYVNPEEGK